MTKTPVHQWEQCLHIGNNDDTASCEVAVRQEAELVHHKAEAARGQEAAAVRQVGPCALQVATTRWQRRG